MSNKPRFEDMGLRHVVYLVPSVIQNLRDMHIITIIYISKDIVKLF
jgi:hypothetical protein